MLTERGENAPYSIWCADEIYNFRDAAYFAELADSTINEMVAEWYSQMPDRELPDDNDLIPFQGMVRRVAARLRFYGFAGVRQSKALGTPGGIFLL